MRSRLTCKCQPRSAKHCGTDIDDCVVTKNTTVFLWWFYESCAKTLSAKAGGLANVERHRPCLTWHTLKLVGLRSIHSKASDTGLCQPFVSQTVPTSSMFIWYRWWYDIALLGVLIRYHNDVWLCREQVVITIAVVDELQFRKVYNFSPIGAKQSRFLSERRRKRWLYWVKHYNVECGKVFKVLWRLKVFGCFVWASRFHEAGNCNAKLGGLYKQH